MNLKVFVEPLEFASEMVDHELDDQRLDLGKLRPDVPRADRGSTIFGCLSFAPKGSSEVMQHCGKVRLPLSGLDCLWHNGFSDAVPALPVLRLVK